MDENPINDPDERFTEELLRATLGPKFTPAILEEIREAENLLIDRKDHLADLLHVGVVTEEEFADKVNRVISVYLRAVADIVGEDACKKMYDFGPDDDVQIVDPSAFRREAEYRATPEVLGAFVTDEWTVAGEGVSAEGGEANFQKELAAIIRFIAAKGDLMIAGHASREEVSRWQAATIAVYLASKVCGDAVPQFIWRISEKILLLGGCRLQADPRAVNDLYALCTSTQIEVFEDGETYFEETEIRHVEQWFSVHSQVLFPSRASEGDDWASDWDAE